MVKALSLKREHKYILDVDKGEMLENPDHNPTTWHYRRLTAEEAWTLRDESLSAVNRAGEQHMHFRSGARQRYVLNRCLVRVVGLEDPDRPGKDIHYPGPRATEVERAAFFDRVPIEWLAEIAEAIHESSEVGEELSGNSTASPSLSLTTTEGEAISKDSA